MQKQRIKPALPLDFFKEEPGDQDTKKTYLRVLFTSADEGKEFNINVSEIVTSELFASGIFTSELFISQVFTSDSVEVVVEVLVSYAFEVVSSEFTKKEMENNSKIKLITYHTFLLQLVVNKCQHKYNDFSISMKNSILTYLFLFASEAAHQSMLACQRQQHCNFFSSDHLYPFFQMNMVFDVMDNCDFCQLDPFPWQIKNQEQRQIN